MSLIRCHVVLRFGAAELPCLVRAEDGALLRLEWATDGAYDGRVGGAPVRVVPHEGDAPEAPAEPGATLLLERTGGEIDEVGVGTDPDAEGGGLFDVTGHTASSTGEPTGAASGRPSARRTALIAAVVAWRPTSPDDATTTGPPCASLLRAIAEEPLDPVLPADGGPLPTRGESEPARHDEDTATQIIPLFPESTTSEAPSEDDSTVHGRAPRAEEPGSRTATLLALSAALALLAAASLAVWRYVVSAPP